MSVLATVRLYKNCAIVPEKNQIVDEIVAYLASLTSVADTYNYVRHNKTLSIVLPKSMNVLTYDAAGMYNYCAIQNNNETYPVYYFVVDRRFTSESAVTFDLEMDVLNTFRVNRDYSFGQNTRTLREHRNRFKLITGSNNAEMVVDKQSEGIFTPQIKTKAVKPYAARPENFYFCYEAIDGVFQRRIYSKTPLTVYINEQDYNFDFTNEASSLYRYFFPVDCSYVKIYIGANVVPIEDITLELYRYGDTCDFVALSDQQILYCTVHNGSIEILNKWDIEYHAGHHIYIRVVAQLLTLNNYDTNFRLKYIDQFSTQLLDPTNIPEEFVQTINAPHNTTTILKSIDTIDRYAERIFKVVGIPLLPELEYCHTDDVNLLAEQHIIYNEKHTPLLSRFTAPQSIIDMPTAGEYTKAQVRAYDGLDPKCFHSDFCTMKFGYDNFNLPLKAELIKKFSSLTIKVVYSEAMLARFALIIENPTAVYNIEEEAINGVMYVARNNEVPLYTSAYLDYINLGYNYDVKAKERAVRAAEIKTGASILSTAAGIGGTIAGIASQNYIVAGMSVAATIAGIVQTITSVQGQIEANDESINRHLSEVERQGVSVRNADDYSIAQEYGGDKILFYIFQPETRVRTLLNRLFKLFGYASDNYGVPSVNTRKYWNFLQADIDLSQTSYMLRGLPKNIRETLIEKYHDGVTFLHGLNPDFAQTQNNYEVIFDEV